MKSLGYLFLVISFLVSTNLTYSQKLLIKGYVKNSNGVGLENVTISSKRNQEFALSHINGSFSLRTEKDATIYFTAIGYKADSIIVKDTIDLLVVLKTMWTESNELVFLGSRSGRRIKTESTVPIDIIHLDNMGLLDSKINLTSMLNFAAPSFNYNKMSGSDGADHIDLGTLRGLGPDQTLVLINGKRRHQTAFIGLFGTRGRGNSGTDLNAFPEAAVDQVEILRDGASAQYGSDAMAGVINIILKKKTDKWNISYNHSFYNDQKFNSLNTIDPSQYYTGKKLDGITHHFSADKGWSIGKNGGSIHVSFNYLNKEKTFRQAPDTNLNTNPLALPINKTRRANGESSLSAWSSMINLEIPIKKTGHVFYSFGGYSRKMGDSYAFTRNASARPDRFPIDENGNIIFVPSIMKKSADGEIFYNPHNQAMVSDVSFSSGIKGKIFSKWSYDISNTIGSNDFHFYGNNTFNASIINGSNKTHFDDGGLHFLQNTTNLDFNRPIKIKNHTLNLALGSEYRYEQYNIYAGEEASYKGYDNKFGHSPGAQGFPGFSPSDVVTGRRTSVSLYGDGDIEISKKWLLSAASRLENFSNIGWVNTYKLASRIKLGESVNWRASISTGFRAPSLQQIYFSNTITSFSFGKLVQTRIASNIDPITRAAGIPNLKEERSLNFSSGFVVKVLEGLNLTLDGYAIKIRNRLVLSGMFSAQDATLSSSFTDKLKSLDVASAQFFGNAVNTTNLGLDFVISYNKKWNKDALAISFNGNFNKVNIDAINIPGSLNDTYIHQKSFFSDREEQFLKASAPASKLVFSVEYKTKKWKAGIREVYFGKVQTLGFGWTGLASKIGTNGPGDPAISGSFRGIDPYVDLDGYNDQIHVTPEIFTYNAKITTDIYGSLNITKTLNWDFGIDNLFNVHPDYAVVPGARRESFVNESGGPWESVQMGFNGIRFYNKLRLSF